MKDNFDDVIVIHKKDLSDYTNNSVAGYHTFYHHIITYEMFPKKTIFLEYEKISDLLTEENFLLKIENSLVVLFDLPNKEIKKLNIITIF